MIESISVVLLLAFFLFCFLWGVGRIGIDLVVHFPVNNFARATALRTRVDV